MEAAALQHREDDVIRLYTAMVTSGLAPSQKTLDILRACFAFGSMYFFQTLLPDLKAGIEDARASDCGALFSHGEVLEAAIAMAKLSHFEQAADLFTTILRSDKFCKKKVRVDAFETYLQVCSRQKQQPLSSEQLLEKTGLKPSEPLAVRMWSLWASAESNSGNVKTAQDLLSEMKETGLIPELDAELDTMASSIAFNISTCCSLEQLEILLKERKVSSTKVEELMGKILGQSGAGRVEADVLLKVLERTAEHLESLTPRTYEVTLSLMLRARSVKGAVSIMDTMEALNLTVSAQAKVMLSKIKATSSKDQTFSPAHKSQEEIQDLMVPQDPAALAEFVMFALESRRMELVVEGWMQMNSLHGNLCAQELVDQVVLGLCNANLHQDALDLLEETGVAIKDITFEQALKTQESAFVCERERARVCVLICPPTKSFLHKQIMRQLHEGSSVQPGGETPASARAVHAILRWIQAASVSASEQTLLRIQMRALEALHMVALFQLFVICLFPYTFSLFACFLIRVLVACFIIHFLSSCQNSLPR